MLKRHYLLNFLTITIFLWPFSAQSMKASPSVDFGELGFCPKKRTLQPLILLQQEPDTPAAVPKFKVYSDDEEVPLEMPLLDLEEDERSPRENYAQGVFVYEQKKYSEALECFIRATSEGSEMDQEKARIAMAHVQNRLGYQHAKKGEYEKARDYFLVSANNENAAAHFNLGLMSLKGHGCDANDNEALSSFKIAYELGHPCAQRCYRRIQMKRAFGFYNNNLYRQALTLLKGIKAEGYLKAEGAILETEFQLGIQLFRNEKYKEALDMWANGKAQGYRQAIYYSRFALKKIRK